MAQSKAEFTASFAGGHPDDYEVKAKSAAKPGTERTLPGLAFSLKPDTKTIAILAVLDDQIVKQHGKVVLNGNTVDAAEYRKKSQAALKVEFGHLAGAIGQTAKLADGVDATMWQSFRGQDPKGAIKKVAGAAAAEVTAGTGEAGKGNLLPAYTHLVKAAELAANANHLLSAANAAAEGQATFIVNRLGNAQTAGVLAGLALGFVVAVPVAAGLSAATTIAVAEGKVIAGEEFSWLETTAEIVVDAILSKFGASLEHEIVHHELKFAEAAVGKYLAKHGIAAEEKELETAIKEVMGELISKAYGLAVVKTTEASLKAAMTSYFKAKEHKEGSAKLDESKASFTADLSKKLQGANDQLGQLLLVHLSGLPQTQQSQPNHSIAQH